MESATWQRRPAFSLTEMSARVGRCFPPHFSSLPLPFWPPNLHPITACVPPPRFQVFGHPTLGNGSGWLTQQRPYGIPVSEQPEELEITTPISASPSPPTPAPPPKKRKRSSNTMETKAAAGKAVDLTSPVSGIRIISASELDDGADGEKKVKVILRDDLGPNENWVEVTPEAREALAKIANRLGDYVCRLCSDLYDDAFHLAAHRCPRLAHVEYKCPECEKTFNCPANLASHQRWHRPAATHDRQQLNPFSMASILGLSRQTTKGGGAKRQNLAFSRRPSTKKLSQQQQKDQADADRMPPCLVVSGFQLPVYSCNNTYMC